MTVAAFTLHYSQAMIATLRAKALRVVLSGGGTTEMVQAVSVGVGVELVYSFRYYNVPLPACTWVKFTFEPGL